MIRFAILKLTAFCNLNCSYCYMFNLGDRTFERVSRMMSPDVAIAALQKIEDYSRLSGGAIRSIVLHGGEPTLWPSDSFETLFGELASTRDRGIRLACGLQTNCYKRLDVDFLRMAAKHEVSLGISLDGPARYNDAQRVDHAGDGSYDRVLANMRSIIEDGYKELIGGLLCVMRPDIPPTEFLDWIDSLPVKRVDLVWPMHYTYDQPPWLGHSEADYTLAPTYGVWLSNLFEEWWRRDNPEIDIGIFNNLINNHLGIRLRNDMLGGYALNSIVIDTDGTIALTDYFRAGSDGMCRTKYSVLQHPLSTILSDQRFMELRTVAQALPEDCKTCPHAQVCAGGTLAGRIASSGTIMNKPSVLCADHKRFFDLAGSRILTSIKELGTERDSE